MSAALSEPKVSVPRRLVELDSVRGLAVLMVIFFHAVSFKTGAEHWRGWPRVLAALGSFGFLGVDLFFVLSGFLITGRLIDTKTDTHYFRNFYLRRALRILPLYYVVLVCVWWFYPRSGAFVLLSFFFLANVTPLFGVRTVYGPLWSLAVEEHFYLIWPWIVRYLRRSALLITLLTVCLGEPLLRGLSVTWGVDVYFYSWFRFDGLAWGALLALLICDHDYRRRLYLLAWGGAVSGVVLFVGGYPLGILSKGEIIGAALQFTSAQLFFFGFIAAAVKASDTQSWGWLRWKWLQRCGDWSYCLYLIHLLLLHVWDALAPHWGGGDVRQAGFGQTLARAAAAITASFLLAAFSYRYFEQPCLSLKDRWARGGQVRLANCSATVAHPL